MDALIKSSASVGSLEINDLLHYAKARQVDQFIVADTEVISPIISNMPSGVEILTNDKNVSFVLYENILINKKAIEIINKTKDNIYKTVFNDLCKKYEHLQIYTFEGNISYTRICKTLINTGYANSLDAASDIIYTFLKDKKAIDFNSLLSTLNQLEIKPFIHFKKAIMENKAKLDQQLKCIEKSKIKGFVADLDASAANSFYLQCFCQKNSLLLVGGSSFADHRQGDKIGQTYQSDYVSACFKTIISL